MNLPGSYRNAKWPIFWLSLSILIAVGYILTYEVYLNNWIEYLILNSALFIGTLLCSYRARHGIVSIQGLIAAIIIAFIFLGYIAKFWIFSIVDSENIAFISPFLIPLLDFKSLWKAYEAASLSLFVMLLVASYILGFKKNSCFIMQRQTLSGGKAALGLYIVSVLVVYLLTGILRAKFDLDSPGGGSNIPFKMGGVIVIANSFVAPLLMLVGLCYSFQTYQLRYAKVIAYLWVVVGIFQFLLFSSKAYLIFPVLNIALASFIYKENIVSKPALLVLAGAFILSYPFLNVYRSFNQEGSIDDVFLLIQTAVEHKLSVSDTGGMFDLYLMGSGLLLGRIMGIDSLLIFQYYASEYESKSLLDILFYDKSISKILTEDIMGYVDYPMGVADTLFGQAFFATNSIFGPMLWGTGWLLLASLIGRVLFIRSNPVMVAICISWIVVAMQWTSGGLRFQNWAYFIFTVLVSMIIVKLMSTVFRLKM